MQSNRYMSLLVQSIYVLLTGLQLVFVPNMLLGIFGFDETLNAPPASIEADALPSIELAPVVHPAHAGTTQLPERHTPRWLGATLDFFGFDETLNAPTQQQPQPHPVDVAV